MRLDEVVFVFYFTGYPAYIYTIQNFKLQSAGFQSHSLAGITNTHTKFHSIKSSSFILYCPVHPALYYI